MEGGVVIGVSMEEKTLFEYPLPPAPYVFFKVNFSMDLKGKFGIVKVESAAKTIFQTQGNLEIEPALTGTLNLGVPKLASVGGGLKGSIIGNMTIPFQQLKNAFEAKMQASWVIRLELLGCTVANSEFPFTDFTLYPWGGKTAYKLAAIDADDFTPIDRPAKIYKRSSEARNFDFYKSSVYSDSAPQLVKLADGSWLLVWVDAAPDRADSDMAALYYSVKDKETGEWTQARMVHDDKTADCMPSLSVVNGVPVLVWVNSNQTWGSEEIGLKKAAENADLSVAAFDTNTKAFTNISALTADNPAYETAVRIVPEGSNTAVYWLETSADNPLLAAGSATIRKSIQNGTSWEASEIASIHMENINGFTAGAIQSEAYVAYADGSSIYYYTDSGSASIPTAGASSSLPPFLSDPLP